MTEPACKLSFQVTAHHTDAHGSVARCKRAELSLDTDLAGRPDAFNWTATRASSAWPCCTTTCASSARCSTP